MTSSIRSRCDVKIALLYSFTNEISTFLRWLKNGSGFVTDLVNSCIMRLWLRLYIKSVDGIIDYIMMQNNIPSLSRHNPVHIKAKALIKSSNVSNTIGYHSNIDTSGITSG